MIEAEWVSPRSAPGKIVHRHYTDDIDEAKAIEKLRSIAITEVTRLDLHVSEVTGQREERKPEITVCYGKRIDDAIG